MTRVDLAPEVCGCAVCGRGPHAINDPDCVPATRSIVEQNRWLIDENTRLRTLLARAGIHYLHSPTERTA